MTDRPQNHGAGPLCPWQVATDPNGKGRIMGITEGIGRELPDLPPDVIRAIDDYDSAWSSGAYGHGLFAEDYPGETAQDHAISDLVSAHQPVMDMLS